MNLHRGVLNHGPTSEDFASGVRIGVVILSLILWQANDDFLRQIAYFKI
jgi:hypothetical protein